MKQPDRFPKGIGRYLVQPSILLGLALLIGSSGVALASVIDSKHNLSSSGPGPVKAVSETQVCVFCHTPHGGDQTAGAPLWNRLLSTATYTPYLSSSTDADQPPGQPGASSKVCLSCHDGTLAIGVVGNLNSRAATIAMNGTTNGLMPDGTVPGTGYTSNLGIDMSNDHPISFIYSATLPSPASNIVLNDGELRPPPVTDGGSVTFVDNRSFGVKPTFPLEDSQMQCPTCHDPHLSTSSSPKFLRGLRLQQTTSPTGGLFSPTKDLMCLACHDKDKAGPTTWSQSAHAYNDVDVANEAYTDSAADLREFPHGTKVWQASCLNCHDTHTVPGARHLLREATDSSNTPKTGGQSALEENCYQCHSPPSTNNVLDPNSPPNIVPDIQSDFLLPYRMPISAQPETHDIGGNFDDSSGGGLATASTGGACGPGDQCGKDFVESEALLGRASAGGAISNRHTECTDCHNPHRTIKNRLFNANPGTPDAAGTHLHNIETANPVAHSNVASGSLRGTFGVEPVYDLGNPEFGTPGIPISFDVKRGDPGLSVGYDVGQAYVTREYQICLKCHSNYAYDDSTPPLLGYTGGTPQYSVNGFDTYLNTAMEFQAPSGHRGAPVSTTDSGAYSAYSADNYRSWHPVIDSTGREVAQRGNASPNLWRAPWNGSDIDGGSIIINSAVDRSGNTNIVTGAVGNQTMYCSDCHGTVSDIANGVVPNLNGSAGAWTEDGKPWGPHGSTEYFILKGTWNTTSAVSVATDMLCFRCHDATQYADATGSPTTVLQSGFSAVGTDVMGSPMTNLHQRHAYYTSTAGQAVTGTVWPSSAVDTYRCTMCHTGTAHGWKNKAFLVNLNDVGPEVNRALNGTIGGALGGESAPGPVILTAGQDVPKGTQALGMAPVPAGYTNGPYYQGALLYINSFKASGNWTKADCANSGCH
jgi:hypothetical protein